MRVRLPNAKNISRKKFISYIILLIFLIGAGFIMYFAFRESDRRTTHETKTYASPNPEILVYNAQPQDTAYSGTVTPQGATQSTPLQFRTIYAGDFGYEGTQRAEFKNTFTRFATNVPVTISVTVPGAPTLAELHSATAMMASSVSNGTVTFTLPAGAGNYYLKTNSTADQGHIAMINFWVDDIATIATSKPTGATEVAVGQSLQDAITAAPQGTTLYLGPGVHTASNITFEGKNTLTIVLHPNAVLKQQGGADATPFITYGTSDKITIKGPGEIQSEKGNQFTVIDTKGTWNATLSDFFLYKVHHRDGFTLYIFQSNNVSVNQVRIISGNDGTDPESSFNVKYNNVFIEAQDDGIAVKSKGGEMNGMEFNHGIVRSAASGLKIGEATINYLTTNINFLNSTVLDTDRALVVNPKGNGKIGTVLYQNIMVRGMRKDDDGKTIRVLKSGSNNAFSGSNIVFDNLDVDFIQPAEINEATTIKHTTIRTAQAMDLFPGTCPTLINLTIVGPGTTDCTITTEATYTPTVPPTSAPTSNPNTPTTNPSGVATPTTIPSGTAPTSTPTTPDGVPTNTPVILPTETPVPTNTLVPTATSVPTETPLPTSTPTPIPTATPLPTLTFTPMPTNTPFPTNTPLPTYTQVPTNPVVTQLVVNGKAPGITPWALILLPIGMVLVGLIL